MINEIIEQFYSQKGYIEKAFSRLSEKEFFFRESDEQNSVAILVKHIGGNLASRYKNILSEDGEKSWRNRDDEFDTSCDSYNSIIEKWNEGWKIFNEETSKLVENDLPKTIYIRGKEHTLLKALLRSLTHLSYHTGQIIMLCKKLKGKEWEALTIPKGKSEEFNKQLFDYNDIYSKYDNYFGSTPEKILTEYIDIINKDFPILDVGAGDGRNSVYLSNAGFNVYALDPSYVSLKRIEQKDNSIILINSDFLSYSTDKEFSAVLLFGIMQIISKRDLKMFIEKIKNVLKDSGLLFFTTFSVNDDSFKKYKKKWNSTDENSFFNIDEYRSFYTVDELKQLLKGEFEELHLKELTGPIHRHGNGFPEQHQIIEGVYRFG